MAFLRHHDERARRAEARPDAALRRQILSLGSLIGMAVIEFPGKFTPVRIELPLGSVDQARRALETIAATVEVGLKVIERATPPAMQRS